MSRNDRRRGGRNRNGGNREGSSDRNRNERLESGKKESRTRSRSERRHESRGSGAYERRQERRRSLSRINPKEIEESQNAIRAFKEQVVTCELCGEQIEDIANAISNRGSGNPVHFDCVLGKIAESEKVASTEKVAYIGQGKFAVIYFANPRDPKHFSIRRTIEWETRETERGSWRNEMAGLFSQVK